MSSVLEALKKMEEEERRAEEMKGPGRLTFPEPGPAPKRGALHLLAFVAVFAAGVGLAAAGFLLAHRPESVAVFADAAPKQASVLRVVAPAAPVVQRPHRAAPLKESATPTAPTPPAVGGPEPAAPQNPTPKDETKRESPADAKPAPPAPATTQVTEAAPAPPEDALEDLPPADPATYRLQGVRWSRDPSRRIAVINSQIVREGAGVDGATVSSITAEGVVLDVAGVRFFLAFAGRG